MTDTPANQQYLLLMENGHVIHANELDQNELDAAKDSYIDIIDITQSDQPRFYINDEWHPVRTKNQVLGLE